MYPRILLVEDQLLMQQVELALLAKAGYQAELASNGEEALVKATQHRYDLILMDVCLPDIEGTEVTQRLRAAAITSPIVAMSGNDDAETRAACRQSGMNGFLAKPMNSDQFRAVVEAFT
jgi:CheY-like chemotaxis protein